MILAGPVGEALAALGNERWQRATNRTLRDLSGVGESWPDDLDPDFRDVEAAISRTRAEYDGFPEIRDIERLYPDLIAGARRFIHFANQYFTCGKIAAATAQRPEEEGRKRAARGTGEPVGVRAGGGR